MFLKNHVYWFSFVALFLIILFILLFFLFGGFRKLRDKDPQPHGLDWGLGVVLIFVTLAMTGLCIGAILLRSSPNPSAEDRLIEMQGITLTITGAAIALLSILTTIQNFDREKKSKQLEIEIRQQLDRRFTEQDTTIQTQENNIWDKIDSEFTKQNAKLKSLENDIIERRKQLDREFMKSKVDLKQQKEEYLRLNEELRKTIRALFDCNMDDEIHRLIRIEKFKETLEKNPNNADVALALIDTLAFKSADKPSERQQEDNEMIIQIADRILDNNRLDPQERANLELKKADACYENGKQYESAGENDKAKEYMDKAQYIFEELLKSSIVPKSLDSYIAGHLGQCYFWQFSVSDKKDIAMLDKSIEYYNRSLIIQPGNVRRLNSLAVSLHNKMRLIEDKDNKIEGLLQVKEEYEKVINADPSKERPWLNVASVNADIIHEMLGINPRENRFQKIPILSAADLMKILELYDNGIEHLEKAMMINPGMVNIYYIHADLDNCKALITKNKELLNNARRYLEIAEKLDRDNRVVKMIWALYKHVESELVKTKNKTNAF